MRNWIIAKLGGYPTIEHALEAFKSPERNQTLSIAIEKLYNTISSDDILRQDGIKLFFRNKELTQPEIEQIKLEAEAFKRSILYKVLDADCRYQANKKMFIEAHTLEQLEAGKLMLYVWDIIKTRVNKL